MKEQDDGHSASNLSKPIQYSDATKLPYLNAVMQETMRLHPVVGIGLPRRVPREGAEICERSIPGGSTIVMNPNVVHRDKKIFGKDAESFRPERWLRDPKQAAHMSRHLIAFGYGRRICLGRLIARTEMYKVLPMRLLSFRFKFESPQREWQVNRGFFQGREGVFIRAQRRVT